MCCGNVHDFRGAAPPPNLLVAKFLVENQRRVQSNYTFRRVYYPDVINCFESKFARRKRTPAMGWELRVRFTAPRRKSPGGYRRIARKSTTRESWKTPPGKGPPTKQNARRRLDDRR